MKEDIINFQNIINNIDELLKNKNLGFLLGNLILSLSKTLDFVEFDNPSFDVINIPDVDRYISAKDNLFLKSKGSDISLSFIEYLFENLDLETDLGSFKNSCFLYFVNFIINKSKTNFKNIPNLVINSDFYDEKLFQKYKFDLTDMYKVSHSNIKKSNLFETNVEKKVNQDIYIFFLFCHFFYSSTVDHDIIFEDFYNIIQKKLKSENTNLEWGSYFYQLGRENTNKIIFSSHFYKIIYSHLNTFLLKNKKIKFSVFQYNSYLHVGEETIKNISYLKKANIPLRYGKPYNKLIENNIEAYNLFKKEYHNLWFLSYSLIGFSGYDQAKKLKEFFNFSLEEKIDNKMKSDDISDGQDHYIFSNNWSKEFESSFFHQIGNKGWKFLLRQNKNYTLRLTRNLKVGSIALNLGLKDSWLRSSELTKLCNNSFLYFAGKNLIEKSILEHKKPVSQYIGFDRKNVYNSQKPINKHYISQINEDFKLLFKKNNYNLYKKINLLNTFISILFYYINSNNSDLSILKKYSNIFILFSSINNKNVENENIIERNFSLLDNGINEDNYEVIYKKVSYLKNDFIELCYKMINSINKTTNIHLLVNHFKRMDKIDEIFNLNYCYYSIFKNTDEVSGRYNEELQLFSERQQQIINNYYKEYQESLQEYMEISHVIQTIEDFINDKLQQINWEEKGDKYKARINKLLFISKSLSKNIKSLDHLLKLANEWHFKVQERKMHILNNEDFPLFQIDKNPEFDEELQHFCFKGVSFSPIKNSYQLFQEGGEMRHCIASYNDYFIEEQYLAFRVSGDKLLGQNRATLGCNVYLENGKYKISFDQFYGFLDEPQSKSYNNLCLEFIDYLNDSLNDRKNKEKEKKKNNEILFLSGN